MKNPTDVATLMSAADIAAEALAQPNARVLVTGAIWQVAAARLLLIEMAIATQQVHRVTRTYGKARIRLNNGSDIQAVSRQGQGGRGYSAGTVIIDELTTEDELAALTPCLLAGPSRGLGLVRMT